MNSEKSFKLFYKKLLKAPAPAFKSNPQLFNGVKISPRAKPGFRRFPRPAPLCLLKMCLLVFMYNI
ncbi:hypothetical protein COT27_00485 [Candidatus Kuenenbacteria bacterium CG08_land_8_20_14_0_20_37_23]|uniref:Uncharacterized protein n=1 Tax=Candidatus Kuenenbacteria bacterium CG08_land_8_20_14_0_20_37_23 TaxID=1974617 RepID=A0A2M6XTN7_9BACT|nr:MAG: hypothetical protein COT27_00485 [Candidatus Kuenenbacteria bacterium CG08_land_8_20_14_0_20_37_23]